MADRIELKIIEEGVRRIPKDFPVQWYLELPEYNYDVLESELDNFEKEVMKLIKPRLSKLKTIETKIAKSLLVKPIKVKSEGSLKPVKEETPKGKKKKSPPPSPPQSASASGELSAKVVNDSAADLEKLKGSVSELIEQIEGCCSDLEEDPFGNLSEVMELRDRADELIQKFVTDHNDGKKVRASPEFNALEEIRDAQRSTDFCIPRAPFHRLVREIAQDFKTDLRFKGDALEALQTAAEDYLIKMFEKSNAITEMCSVERSQKGTLTPQDMRLARYLAGK